MAATRAKDEHTALVLDGAGWHTANDLKVPDTVTLIPLPSHAPVLNLVERVWLYGRERHLSHLLEVGIVGEGTEALTRRPSGGVRRPGSRGASARPALPAATEALPAGRAASAGSRG
ncbi:transposase [Roseomonas sp. AR75]|uniref:transposase n=1 Tax=Roseomonas sp. AR75 TaxID=2562311 RepID=UPI0010C0CCC4